VGRLSWLNIGPLQIRLEFKLQDLWIGVFWKRVRLLPCKLQDVIKNRIDPATLPVQYDMWICLVPALPIHLRWVRKPT
jgi:hypothetical protein